MPELTDSPNIFITRLFPVFHAYMAGIVQVLDQNQEWGGELLNLTLQLLLFCAAPKPQKRTHIPEFSLVRIPLDIRQTWLMACLIILYKVTSFKPDHDAPKTCFLRSFVLSFLRSIVPSFIHLVSTHPSAR